MDVVTRALAGGALVVVHLRIFLLIIQYVNFVLNMDTWLSFVTTASIIIINPLHRHLYLLIIPLYLLNHSIHNPLTPIGTLILKLHIILHIIFLTYHSIHSNIQGMIVSISVMAIPFKFNMSVAHQFHLPLAIFLSLIFIMCLPFLKA